MRLWTLHPRYLDSKGLVALWRESLLAQAVLLGRTRGYQYHPQLIRFRAAQDPVSAVTSYLRGVLQEACDRGYSFDPSLIAPAQEPTKRLVETRGQLLFEWAHLQHKLSVRDPALHKAHRSIRELSPHPLFRIVAGGVREWERPKEHERTKSRV